MIENVRPWVYFLAIIVLVGAGAYTAGRYTAPEKTVTRDVEHVVYKDKIVEVVKTVEVKGKTETKIVYRERETKPDGTVTEREKEETKTKEDTTKTDDATKTEKTGNTADRTSEKTVTLRPDWRVGVLVGGSLRDPLIPIYGPLVIGLQVDRRIVGGLSAGLWINTFGAAGVGLSFEF